MANISKLRALHDIKQNFALEDHQLESLASQLADDERTATDRFFSGFEIEDWFEAIFGIMPWTRLLHGLSQRQFPTQSKADIQVPDFTAFIESSTFKSEPLLIEVKRVTGKKQTLKLRKSQPKHTPTYSAFHSFTRSIGMRLTLGLSTRSIHLRINRPRSRSRLLQHSNSTAV